MILRLRVKLLDFVKEITPKHVFQACGKKFQKKSTAPNCS
jgi:hypothetical protein